MDIQDLSAAVIEQLNHIFQSNKGDNQVTFEVLEIEKTKKIVESQLKYVENEEIVDADIDGQDELEIENQIVEEKNHIVNKVSMPSRKLKVKISSELLLELEKLNLKFSLN